MKTFNIRSVKFLSLSLLFLVLAQAAVSQTPHLVGWHTKKPFQSSFASCFQKSYDAVEASSLENIQTYDGWMVSGSSVYLRAAISCIQVSNGTMINIQVAAEENHEMEALAMRDYLKAYLMTDNFPDVSSIANNQALGGNVGPMVRVRKLVYKPAELITVDFANLPAERRDEWITIVPYDYEAGEFRQWKYTGKKESGSLEFMGLTRGRYEARFHYANGDKEVRARYQFTVK
ncbi:MAG: hypothetical protein O7C75_15340 [Verrucomicrobia bacterium]|nr:hypothetical protein [Verrucomicrobiota bacterium]